MFFCTGSPEQKVALPEKENLIEGKKGLHVGVYHKTNWSSIKRNLSTGMNKAELQLARQNWYLLYKTSDLRRDFNKCELADKRTLESKVKDNKVVPRYPQFMWHTCQPWSKNVQWKKKKQIKNPSAQFLVAWEEAWGSLIVNRPKGTLLDVINVP